MVDWKHLVKKTASEIGKNIVKGTKIAATEIEKSAKSISRKSAILGRMSKKQIKQMARDFDVRLVNYNDEPRTVNQVKGAIASRLSLIIIVEYARKRGVRVDDILSKMDEEKSNEEFETMKKQGTEEPLIVVTDAIREFKPARDFENEWPYQIGLHGFLQRQFPMAKIEQSKGSARPDIVIGGIAIEVKGPTRQKDLDTIASKCMRYRQLFKKGLIVVLFKQE